MKGFSKIIVGFIILILLLFFFTKQCSRGEETLLQVYEQDTSLIIIPINIDITSFESVFNQKLNEKAWFYEKEDMKVNRSLSISYRVRKLGKAELYPEDGFIKVKLPLLIDIRPEIHSSLSLGLGKDMQMEAQVLLESDIGVDIDKNWELITNTTTNFRVLESPKLSIGGLQIDFKSQIESNLKTAEKQINKLVEEQVRTAIPTKQIIQSIWKELKTPYQIKGKKFQSWATIQPIEVKVSNLHAYQPGVMQTVFAIPSIIKINTGASPTHSNNQELPQAQRLESIEEKNSLFLFPLKIPFSSFLTYLNQLENIPFQLQGREVTLSNFQIDKKVRKLRLRANYVTGDNRGELELIGRPKFDEEKQTIYVELSSLLSTSNSQFIDRLVNNLQKSKAVKNKIENYLTYSLQNDLSELNFIITKQLQNTQFNDFVSLNGYLDHIAIRNIYVQDGYFLLDTEIEAQTQCIVKATN